MPETTIRSLEAQPLAAPRPAPPPFVIAVVVVLVAGLSLALGVDGYVRQEPAGLSRWLAGSGGLQAAWFVVALGAFGWLMVGRTATATLTRSLGTLSAHHPLLLAALVAAALSAEHFVLLQWSYVPTGDQLDSVVAWYANAARDFRQYGVSHWDPSMVAGIDRLPLLAYSSPFFVLYLILPAWLAFAASTLALGAVAFLGMRHFLHNIWGLESFAAAAAAAVFAVLAVDNGWTYNLLGVAAFPFALASLERWAAQARFSDGLASMLLTLLAYGWAADLARTIPFAAAFAGVWLVFVARAPVLKALVGSTALFVLGVLAHTPELLALIQNAPVSHRGVDRSYVPLELRTALAPLLTWQTLSLALATIVGLIAAPEQRRKIASVAAIFILAAESAILWRPVADVLGSAWEPLRGFNFTRVDLFVPVAGAAIVGIVLHGTQSAAQFWRAGAVGIVVASCLLSVGWAKAEQLSLWLNIGSFRFHYPTDALANLRPLADGQSLDTRWRVVTLFNAHNRHDRPILAAHTTLHGLEAADGKVGLYNSRYREFWERVIGPATEADPWLNEYFSEFGNRAYLFVPEGMAGKARDETRPDAPWPGLGIYSLDLLSLANVRYLVSPHPIADDRLVQVLSPLRDVPLSMAGKARANFAGRQDLFIYENPHALPRAFIANDAIVVASREAAFDTLAQMTAAELRRTVVLERDAALPAVADARNASADEQNIELSAWLPDEVALRVRTAGSAFVVLSIQYNVSWACAIDGRQVDVLPADGAFMAIHVGGGASDVVCRYRPPYRLLPF